MLGSEHFLGAADSNPGSLLETFRHAGLLTSLERHGERRAA